MYIFIDSEGEPVQELSAICVNTETFQIISVFHRYAQCPLPDEDYYSRRFIHGLNIDFLMCHGFPSVRELTSALCRWIDNLPRFHNYFFFANDPTKERHLFPFLHIEDVKLPQWRVRIHTKPHIMAKAAKDNAASVLDCSCSATAVHSAYDPSHRPECSLSPSTLAKLSSGHHCSLYDVMECYFTFCCKALGK